MILEHAFNSSWSGTRAGILQDPRFFELRGDARTALLDGFDWVELRCDCRKAPSLSSLASYGFFQVDVQLHFRVSLPVPSAVPMSEPLEVRWASDVPTRLSAAQLADFGAERFRQLPGIDAGKLKERYAQWGNDLLTKQPKWCLSVWRGGEVQGWFLSSSEDERSVHLTLATLKEGAGISSAHLYQAALDAYAKRGATLGWAAFSAMNLSVLNLYSAFGCRFAKAEGCWLWLNPRWSERKTGPRRAASA